MGGFLISILPLSLIWLAHSGSDAALGFREKKTADAPFAAEAADSYSKTRGLSTIFSFLPVPAILQLSYVIQVGDPRFPIKERFLLRKAKGSSVCKRFGLDPFGRAQWIRRGCFPLSREV